MVIPRKIEGLISFLIDQKPQKEKDNSIQNQKRRKKGSLIDLLS